MNKLAQFLTWTLSMFGKGSYVPSGVAVPEVAVPRTRVLAHAGIGIPSVFAAEKRLSGHPLYRFIVEQVCEGYRVALKRHIGLDGVTVDDKTRAGVRDDLIKYFATLMASDWISNFSLQCDDANNPIVVIAYSDVVVNVFYTDAVTDTQYCFQLCTHQGTAEELGWPDSTTAYRIVG